MERSSEVTRSTYLRSMIRLVLGFLLVICFCAGLMSSTANSDKMFSFLAGKQPYRREARDPYNEY